MRGMLLGSFVVGFEDEAAPGRVAFEVTGVVMDSERLRASGSICIVAVAAIGGEMARGRFDDSDAPQRRVGWPSTSPSEN